MTIDEFRKLYKETKCPDDVEQLLKDHFNIIVADVEFEFNDCYVLVTFTNDDIKHISYNQDDSVMIDFRKNDDTDVSADESVRLFITYSVTVVTSIFDILAGKTIDAKIIEADIDLNSDSSEITWDDLNSFVIDPSNIIGDGDYNDMFIEMLEKLITFDIIKEKDNYKDGVEKQIYDEIMKNNTDNNIADAVKEAFNNSECKNIILENFNAYELFDWVNELYSYYSDQVDAEYFNDCAKAVVDDYYCRFSINEIIDYSDINCRGKEEYEDEESAKIEIKFV